MWGRIKNLWAWSSLSPYELGKETGKALLEATQKEKAEIVYPNYTEEKFKEQDEPTLEEITESLNG